MTADQATADIIHLVYEAAVISPDPFVQETHVETSIRDVLDELLKTKTVDVERLEEELTERDVDYQTAVEKLRYTQNLLGEYVGK